MNSRPVFFGIISANKSYSCLSLSLSKSSKSKFYGFKLTSFYSSVFVIEWPVSKSITSFPSYSMSKSSRSSLANSASCSLTIPANSGLISCLGS